MVDRSEIFPGADLRNRDLSGQYLIGVDLTGANLSGANLSHALLESAILRNCDLSKADLTNAYLVDSNLSGAILRGARLRRSSNDALDLTAVGSPSAIAIVGATKYANWSRADLSNTDLVDADLSGGVFDYADFSGANLDGGVLNGVRARYAIVDGRTFFPAGMVDRQTDFTGVGLSSARIAPELRAKLELARREKMWEDWYARRGWLASLLARWFWKISDYGGSTSRIVWSFTACVFAFALLYVLPEVYNRTVYCGCGKGVEPFVSNLGEVGGVSIGNTTLVVRALYFSVVTMTTLGFGDISANPASPMGHILVAMQVVLGYVILGALVTRLGILFQS